MNPVTLTNVFEIESGEETLFLQRWERIMTFLEQQQGFVSVALCESPDPGSRFRFTAKTTFASQDQLWRALRRTDFQRLAHANDLQHFPGVFDLFLTPQAQAAA